MADERVSGADAYNTYGAVALMHRDAGLEATQVFVSRPLIDGPTG